MAQALISGNNPIAQFKLPDFGGPSGFTPQTLSIEPDNDTVSGQLDAILKKGESAYVDRARASAADTANRRGLINSSIAAGAGEAAAIDAALPIAQANAQAYQGFKSANQNAYNTAAQFGASASNDSYLQQLRGNQATQLANIEASYKTQIQSSDASAKIYQQTVDALNKIFISADLSPAAKDNAVNRQIELLQTGLGIIGGISDQDLVSLLNFTGVTGNPTPENAVISAPSQPGAAPGTNNTGGDGGDGGDDGDGGDGGDGGE